MAPLSVAHVLQQMRSPKYLTLILLVAQTSASVLMMRKCQEGSKFLVISVVVTTEIVKMVVAGAMMLREKSVSGIIHDVCGDRRDFFLIALPGLLYTIQNTLLYVALSNLSGAVYQVTYQLKILTTGALSVVILGTVLLNRQWAALVMLAAGVSLIQWQDDFSAPVDGNPVTGTIAVLAACGTSATAGILLERMIKRTTKNVLIRTIQLALWGTAMGLAAAFWKDADTIAQKGFFYDYSPMVWCAILLQAVGGIIIGFVMKYAGNILKCFANALSIMLTMTLEGGKGFGFIPGTSLVILATVCYNIDGIPEKLGLTRFLNGSMLRKSHNEKI
eukprot:GEMP01056804.1.p1 GENE.GEMP01056804.1~~GEMP01056804.1.p1  ORF type:complete len:360 (-),score=50.47 GEMP01056804.1:422-1417(-)